MNPANFYRVSIRLANKNSLCFIPNSLTIAVGDRKSILRSIGDINKWEMISYVSGYSYNDPPYTPDFFKVNFLNDSIGYLLGALRAIYHTTNGGATWLPQDSNSIELYNMHDINFSSSGLGFAVASNSKFSVVKTSNGGKTYTPYDTVNQGFIPLGNGPKIRFWNSTLALITGSYINPSKGILNISEDGGKIWKKKILENIYINDSRWVDDSTILLTGATVMISRDRGETWDSASFQFPGQQSGCWAIDDKNLIVTGGYETEKTSYGLVFRSSDGGHSWYIVDSSTDKYYYHSVSFSNRNLGYTISRKLMQTKDGGFNWKSIEDKCPIDTGYFIRLSALPSGNVVVTTSQPNMVLRSNFREEVLAVDEPKVAEAVFALVWLYSPRPIPSTGKIKLDAIWIMNLDISTIRIKLYDMLGIELQDITDSFHANSGTNTGIVEFDGSKLPTGIYYIEINGGGYRKAVPVIIAR